MKSKRCNTQREAARLSRVVVREFGPAIRAINSRDTLNTVLQSMVPELEPYVCLDRFSICSVEGDMKRILVVASPVDIGIPTESTYPLQDSPVGWVVRNRRSNIETDFSQKMRFDIDRLEYRKGIRSAVRVPLFSRGKVIGTIGCLSARPNAYGEGQQRVMELIAAYIAGFVDAYVACTALHREQMASEALLDLVQTVANGLGTESLAESFATKFKQLVPFDHVTMHLPDRNGGSFRVVPIVPPGGATPECRTVPLKGTSTERVISQNLSHELADNSQWSSRYVDDATLARKGYRAVIRAPLAAAGKPFGCLNVMSHRPQVYGDEHRHMVERLCSIIGPIIWHQYADTRKNDKSFMRPFPNDNTTRAASPVPLLPSAISENTTHPTPFENSEKPLVLGTLVIDFSSCEVRDNGNTVQLTPMETKLLHCLAQREGTVVPYQTLWRCAWGGEYVNAVPVIRTGMWRLKTKLAESRVCFGSIISHRGVGYRLVRARPSTLPQGQRG